MGEPARRRATWEDLAVAPAHMIAELADGELHLAPRPATPHAATSLNLAADVRGRYRDRRRSGWVILAEPELHLGRPDPRDLVLVPDVAGWRRERLPVMPHVAAMSLAPDWICEVLSPSTARFDRLKKMAWYGAAGVGWAWLVDPIGRSIEVYRHDGAHWVWLASHEGDGLVTLPPFDEAPFDVGAWWPEGGDPDAAGG